MTDKGITLYWLPHCTTCQKALKYLESNGRKVSKFRDVKSEPLGRDEVERLAKLVGGADELFSRRARKYREMNLSDQELSSERMQELMADEYTFIKRPVIEVDGRALAGFTPKVYDRFFDEQ